jgi:arsenite transporter
VNAGETFQRSAFTWKSVPRSRRYHRFVPDLPAVVAELERHQVPIYVGAILAGIVLGLAAPGIGPVLEPAIDPVLGLLLYVTFLQVPARDLLRSLRAGRFLAAVLVVNVVAVPLLLAAALPLFPADEAVRVGMLLVLLAPCVDYVIVFSGLAGGAADRLLAATPLLLLAQMALLPVCLGLFGAASTVDPGPFVEAFLLLIVLPLAAAWLTQRWVRAEALMVPLMVLTLLVVVASQVPRVGAEVLGAVPFYVAFLLVMAVVGAGVARLFRLGVPEARAVVFSGATRNSLVVLPIALTLPPGAAAVVVAQTLVEVVGMVVYVRAVPRLVTARTPD